MSSSVSETELVLELICDEIDGELQQPYEVGLRLLASIDARIEPAGCEDESMFRLARSADDGEAYVFPGEIGEFDDGVTVLVSKASCENEYGAEFWDLVVVAWR